MRRPSRVVMVSDIGHEEEGPSIIFMDNKGLISNTLSTPKHEANKHLRAQLYYKNELAQEGKIKLEYLETKRMLADMMTKQIPGPRFNDFTRIILGYQYVPEKDGISLARAGPLRIAYEQAMARKAVRREK